MKRLKSTHVQYITVWCALLIGVSTASAQESPGERLSPAQRAKAEALLHSKLPCLGCHALRAQGGRIGPELTAVGERMDRSRLRAQIAAPAGLMPRIPLEHNTLELLVAYLAEQRGTGSGAQTSAPVTPTNLPAVTAVGGVQRGEQLYARHCAACHGTTGKGDGWNAAHLDRPPARHADARAMGARTDDRLFDAIHAGSAIMGGSARMPPFGATLNAADIRLLVSHIRRLCRCQQPAWVDAR